jgi:RNA polymerase sigma-70 factor (ECF subfamily)
MSIRRRRVDLPPADADPFTADLLAFLDALYGSAVRLTGDPDTARDLVQDTCLRAFRARSRFAPGSNLKAWLYTILHNTWRNRRRDQSRDRVEADSDTVDRLAGQLDADPSAGNPEALLLDDTLSEDLKAALDALPEGIREAVWLRDVEELSYQEIATALDVPIGTVMSRLSRGRRQLYRALTAGRNAGRTNAS